MPLASDPNAVVSFTHPRDAHMPEAERPVYRARFMTCREWQTLFDLPASDGTFKGRSDYLDRIIAMAMVGWSNLKDPAGNGIPFDVPRINDALTRTEKDELVSAMLEAITLAESDLKKSASQSESEPASTAAAVPAVA